MMGSPNAPVIQRAPQLIKRHGWSNSKKHLPSSWSGPGRAGVRLNGLELATGLDATCFLVGFPCPPSPPCGGGGARARAHTLTYTHSHTRARTHGPTHTSTYARARTHTPGGTRPHARARAQAQACRQRQRGARRGDQSVTGTVFLQAQDRCVAAQDRSVAARDRFVAARDRSVAVRDRSVAVWDRSVAAQDPVCCSPRRGARRGPVCNWDRFVQPGPVCCSPDWSVAARASHAAVQGGERSVREEREEGGGGQGEGEREVRGGRERREERERGERES